MLGVREDANAWYSQQEDSVVHPQLPPGTGRDHVCAVLATATEEYLNKRAMAHYTSER